MKGQISLLIVDPTIDFDGENKEISTTFSCVTLRTTRRYISFIAISNILFIMH